MLDINALDRIFGCILLQEQPEGLPKLVVYWLRSLRKGEQVYETMGSDCFTVVWAIPLLEWNIRGSQFTFRADHIALQWILTITDLTGKQTIWRLELSALDFRVQTSGSQRLIPLAFDCNYSLVDVQSTQLFTYPDAWRTPRLCGKIMGKEIEYGRMFEL